MASAKEIVDQSLAAWRARELEPGTQLFAEDAVLSLPGGAELFGQTGSQQFYVVWNTAFPDNEITIHREYVAGSTVIQEATFSGTHTGDLMTPGGQVVPPTGRRLSGRYVGIWTVDADHITCYALYFDQVELMTQLGLMPAMAGSTAG